MSKLYVDSIASKTGGTDALTIDSSGRIKQPTKPVFYAIGQNLGWISISNTGALITGWDTSTSHYINQGGMSYSGGRVTVPVAGIYRLTGQIMARFTQGQYVLLRPALNAAIQNSAQVYTTSGTLTQEPTLSSNILINCSANDILDFRVQGSNGPPYYYLSSYSNFGIELVS